jgi:hypothetical protein
MKIESVSYRINWKKFKKGYSFFVPCIDPEAARETVHKLSKRLKFAFVSKVVIEDGVKGLRIWRV